MKARPESVKRPRGRPRDSRADGAILDAALDAFIEDGYERMTVEVVAERAGVAKATVYRRWPSKQELALAAVERLVDARMRVPQRGDVNERIVAILRQARDFLTETKAGLVLPRMARELAAGTPLGLAYRDKVMGPRLLALRDALAQAAEGGELREDLDADLATASIVGPMMFLLLTGKLRELGADTPERLARQVLDGIAAPGPGATGTRSSG